MRRVTGRPWIADIGSWAFPKDAIRGAGQKERGLWRREWCRECSPRTAHADPFTDRLTRETKILGTSLNPQTIDKFRYIKIQSKTIDLSTRLVGITTEFVGFIPTSLVPRSIVLDWILIYRNWSIPDKACWDAHNVKRLRKKVLSSRFSGWVF